MPLLPGFRLGQYEVTAAIGAGGMGEVYRARDTKLGRDVALKILPESFAHDADRLARFQREAEVLASLNHPHIAGIYGLEDAGPVKGLVLELVDGPTLADVIGGGPEGPPVRPTEGAPGLQARGMPLDEVLPIAQQMIDALEAAHGRGIVHRDLKPANVKVRTDGTVKVLDFGLAKALSPAAASGVPGPGSLTMTSPAMTGLGIILGTAAYMAPEQAKGRDVDARADIWGFGCVLFEMLTGRRAFDGDDMSDTLANILKSEPDWAAMPTSVPPRLVAVLRRCLRTDPRERYRDIGDVRIAIEDGLAAAPESTAVSAPQPTPAPRWGARIAFGALAIALVAAAPFAIAHFRETPAPVQTIRFAVPPPAGARFSDLATRANATISPDGRWITFRATRPSRSGTALWLRDVASLEVRELPGTDNANAVFWSPDSRSIAFQANGKLRRLNLAGGPPQELCDTTMVLGGAWSSDGTILFSDPSLGGLVRVRASGGEAVPITKLESGKELSHAWPQLLPGEKRLLYTSEPGHRVMTVSIDGTGPTHIVDTGSQAVYANGYLLYLRQGALVAHPFDASRGGVTGDPLPIAGADRVQVTGVFGGGITAVFSASTTGALTFEPSNADPGGQAVWVDRQGKETGAGPSGKTSVENPRLSPDGKRLAIIVNGDLWVYDVQGRPPIRLSFTGATLPNHSPVWTPNGQRIIVEPTTSTPFAPLISFASDGSNSTPLPASGNAHLHGWSWLSGGQELVAAEMGASQTTGTDLVVISTTAPFQKRALVATPFSDGSGGAAVSPDGKWLAYTTSMTGATEIWVRPAADAGAAVRVSPNTGREPIWARNGRELFYFEGNAIMAVAVEPASEFRFKPPVKLFEGTYARPSQPPSWDVASDGRFLLLKPLGDAALIGTAPLTVVMNWPEELARQRR